MMAPFTITNYQQIYYYTTLLLHYYYKTKKECIRGALYYLRSTYMRRGVAWTR